MTCDHQYGDVQQGLISEYMQCKKCGQVVNIHEPVIKTVSKWAKIIAPIVQLVNLVRGKK